MPKKDGGSGITPIPTDTSVGGNNFTVPEIVQNKGGPAASTVPEVRYDPAASLSESLHDVYRSTVVDFDPKETRAPELALKRQEVLKARYERREELLASDDPMVSKFVNERLSYFNPDTIALSPNLVWKYAFGRPAASVDIEKVAENLNVVVPWLNKVNRFGNEDGALNNARAYARVTGNKTAMDFLDAISVLDPLAQRMLLEQLRDPDKNLYNPRVQSLIEGVAGTPEDQVYEGLTIPGLTDDEINAWARAQQFMEQKFGMVLFTNDPSQPPHLTFTHDGYGEEFQKAIAMLFPQNPYIWSSTVDTDSSWNKFTKNPAAWAANQTNDVLSVAALPFQGGLALARGGLRRLMNVGVDVGELFAGYEVSEERRQEIVEGALDTKVAGVSINPVDAFETGFYYFDRGVRDIIRVGLVNRFDLGTAEEEAEIETALAGITEMWILGKVGEFSRSAKLGKTTPNEIASGMLGIDQPFSATTFGRVTDPILSKVLHPSKTVTNLVRRAGLDMSSLIFDTSHGVPRLRFTKGLSDFVYNQRPIQGTFDQVAKINARHNTVESRVGAIMQNTKGTIPAELASRLARAERSSFEAIWLDWYQAPRKLIAESTAIADRIKARQDYTKQLEEPHLTEVTARRQEFLDRALEQRGLAAEAPDIVTRLKHEGIERMWNRRAADLEISILDAVDKAAQARLANAVDFGRLAEATGQLNGVPRYRYPRTAVIKRFFTKEVDGIAAVIADSFWGKPLRELGLKFVDDLPTVPTLWTPYKAQGRPHDWVEQNVATFERWGGRAGIPDELLKDLLGELAEVKTRGEMYSWAERARDAVDAALPKSTPPEMRAELTRWFDRPSEARARTNVVREYEDIHGITRRDTEPVIPRSDPSDLTARPTALPDAPSLFLTEFDLPDVNVLISATSNIQRGMRWAGKHRWQGGFIPEAVYHGTKAILSTGTRLFKAPILVLRLPALAQRIMMEQMIRAHFAEGFSGMLFFPNGLRVPAGVVDFFSQAMGGHGHGLDLQLVKPDPRFASARSSHDVDLGSVQEQLSGAHDVTRVSGELDMTAINNRRYEPKQEHYVAYAELIERIRADSLDLRFIETGMDVEGFIAYLEAQRLLAGPHATHSYGDQLDVLRDSDLAFGARQGRQKLPVDVLIEGVQFPGRMNWEAEIAYGRRTREGLEMLELETARRGDVVAPIQVDYNPYTREYFIPQGHTRLEAARRAGLTEVTVDLHFTDRVGPSRREGFRDVQVEQLERGGLSASQEAAAQDAFAASLFDKIGEDLPSTRTFYHVADKANLESIGRTGLRKGFDPAEASSKQGVFAFTERPKTLGPDQVVIEFRADPARILTERDGKVHIEGEVPATDIVTAHHEPPRNEVPVMPETVLGGPLTDVELLRVWLERKRDSFQSWFDNDPYAREAIVTGKYGDQRTEYFDGAHPSGMKNSEVRTQKTDELTAVSNALRDLQRQKHAGFGSEELNAQIAAFHRRRRALRQELDMLPITEPQTAEAARIGNHEAVASRMQQAYRGGVGWKFPQTLQVKQKYSLWERLGAGEQRGAFLNAWSNAWYKGFKPLSYADVKLSRGSTYYQYYDGYYRGLRKQGYSEKQASVFASEKAAYETKDLMYDLSSRTSVQRALKDTFWFAPAAQEILYTWAIKMPSKYAMGTGLFLIPAKAKAFMNVLRATGIMREDEDFDGNKIEVIGAQPIIDFVDKLMPGELPDDITGYFDVRGFNLIASQPTSFGGLGTFPSLALSKARREYGGVFKDLTEYFNKFGVDVQGVPRQVIAGWEALTGNPFPVEWASPDYTRAQYNRGYDQAIQFAFQARLDAGNEPPRPEEYKTREEYEEARDAWTEGMMQEAEDYFKGIGWTRLASASVTPASIFLSNEERNELTKLWKRVDLMSDKDEETGSYTIKQRELIDTYVSNHPESFAYTIGYTVHGEAGRDLPFEPSGDTEFWDKVYTGELRILSPEDYAQKIMAIESYRYYIAQKNAQLKRIGDTAPEILSHGQEKGLALALQTEGWNRWLTYNKEAAALLDASRRSWEKEYGIPANTYEQERLSTTIEYLRELAPLFTGEGGLRSQEYKEILGQLKATWSEEGTFGPPSSQLAKDMSWYYNNVLDGYFEATEPLYQQALDLRAMGQDASQVYEEIKNINNSYGPKNLKHNGMVFPSPEEVFFGNKTKGEQKIAVLSWTTRPPNWLTDFQLKKVGLDTFKGRDKLLTRLNKFDADLDRYITNQNVSSSSEYYDKLQTWAKGQREQIAADYGQAGKNMLTYYNMTPAERLDEMGYSDMQTWEQTLDATKQISATIRGNGNNPGYWSEYAITAKIWLFQRIEQLRDENKQYDKLWENLSRALPAPDLDEREGVLLYNAVLFGNFDTRYIPDEVIDQSYGGS